MSQCEGASNQPRSGGARGTNAYKLLIYIYNDIFAHCTD